MIGPYDILLVIVVSAQATALAYVYNPRWKAFALTLPVPFTCASLALGQRIDATNVAGTILLLVYAHGVRIMYQRFHLPIVLTIVVSAAVYSVLGWTLAGVMPAGNGSFWIVCGGTIGLAVWLLLQSPHRDEPGHRTTLAVWLKLSIIVAVVVVLVLVKNQLRGFMTMFPMVGVIAAYESRHSLSTMCRQIPVIMIAMVPLMAVSRLTHDTLGLPGSLALGWVVFLAVLAPVTRAIMRQS